MVSTTMAIRCSNCGNRCRARVILVRKRDSERVVDAIMGVPDVDAVIVSDEEFEAVAKHMGMRLDLPAQNAPQVRGKAS